MEDTSLSSLISAVTTDSETRTALRNDPQALADKFGFGEAELEALRSADLLYELDRDPLGKNAITLTGTVTKTQCYGDFTTDGKIRNLDRFSKRELIRLLKLSLSDKRFAQKLRTDLSL